MTAPGGYQPLGAGPDAPVQREPVFPEMSQLERNKALVRAFVAAVNRQDWDAVGALVRPDFRRHSAAAGPPGVESAAGLIGFLRGEYATFPDAAEELLDLVAEGDRVAARHRFRGPQLGALGPYPPTGRVLEATYLAIYRLEEGRIAEAWAEWDSRDGLRQLGHLGDA